MENIRYINAGAGTGKTYTITHELADLLAKGMLSPSNVIATTFTNAAAAEIKSRARQVLLEKGMIPEAAQIDSAAIGTIHSVAQNFLKKYWYELGATPTMDLMTDIDKKIYSSRSISNMLENADYSKQRQAIDRYYDEFRPQKAKEDYRGEENDPGFWVDDLDKLVSKITYYKLSNADIEESKAKSKEEFKRYYGESETAFDCIDAMFDLAKAWVKDYEKFKRQHSVIDYDDMEKGFLELLEKPEVVNDIKSSYKLVLVDEFQDCNPIQLKIFSRLAEIIIPAEGLKYNSIWVGDPKQSIYGFRGANAQLTNRVVGGLKAEELDTSYRTRESLVKAINGVFLDKNFFPDMVELNAKRKDREGMKNSVVNWHFKDAKDAEYKDHLARHIKDIVNNTGEPYIIEDKDTGELRPLQYKDIAILCHKNTDVSKMINALNTENIPAIAPEKSIMDRAEVQLLLSLILLSENPKNAHELASVLHLLYDWDTEKILRSRIEEKSEKKEDWLSDSDELKTIMTVIKHTRDMSMSEKVATFIIEFRLNDKVKKWGNPETRKLNLKTFYAYTKNFEAYCKRFDMKERCEDLQRYIDATKGDISAKDNTAEAVKVHTYHGSKGLEWPMVILDGFQDEDKASLKTIKTFSFFGVTEMQKDEDKDGMPSYYLRYFPKLKESEHTLDESLFIASDFFKDVVKHSHAEMKNLLYVGATRARDYLVLNCFGKEGKTPWLDGIDVTIGKFTQTKSVFERLMPIKSEYKKAEYPIFEEKKANEEKYRAERAKPKTYTLCDIKEVEDIKSEHRYVNPSKLGKKDADEVIDMKMYSVGSNALAGIDDEEGNEERTAMNKIGTCIHNIYAACPSDGSAPTADERERFINTARQIIRNYDLQKVLTAPEAIANNLYALYSWLTEKYGKATEICHEYPFNFPLNDQQVIKGEIDLIWRTADGDVVVDFKNIRGEASELFDKQSHHYVGHHYVPQLLAYKGRLVQAGHSVKACVLFYNIGNAVVF